MSVLILNAGTASPVAPPIAQGSQGAPIYIGSKSQSFAGQERSSVRGIRRTWQVVTSQLTDAERASIESITSRGQQIPCSGDLLGGLQTQCSVEVTNVSGVQGLTMWILSLTLTEVSGSVVILKLATGDTITGESFARSTVARQRIVDGTWQSVAINTKRNGHYIGGIPYFLREDARTNSCLRCSDLSVAPWVKTGTGTATVNAFAVDGSVTGTTIADTDAAARTDWTQSTAVPVNSQTHCVSFYIQKDAVTTRFPTFFVAITGGTAVLHSVAVNTQTGASVLNNAVGGGSHRVIDGGIWWIVEITVTNNSTASNTLLSWSIQPAYGSAINVASNAATGSLIVAHVQVELNAAFFSSPILTTAAAVLRAADFYSLPYTTPPGEATAYADIIELGSPSTGGRVFAVTSAADAGPEWIIYSKPGGLYATFHANSIASSVESPLAAAASYGDRDELLSHLFGDGSVDTTQSLNGAAATTSIQSAAPATTPVIATAWSGQLCWIGSSGTVAGLGGFFALRSFKIVGGSSALKEMQAA